MKHIKNKVITHAVSFLDQDVKVKELSMKAIMGLEKTLKNAIDIPEGEDAVKKMEADIASGKTDISTVLQAPLVIIQETVIDGEDMTTEDLMEYPLVSLMSFVNDVQAVNNLGNKLKG